MRVKENKCKEKRIYGWCVSRKKNTDVAWRVVGKPGHAAYTTTPDHNIQSIAQDMTQVLRAGEHLRHAKGSDGCSPDWWVQFYVPPMPTLDRCSVSSNGVSWRRGSSAWGKSREFENGISKTYFQVEEKMKVIKEIRECLGRFFYQEENFNFSPFRRKLKFHIFSCLKFCFKITKIYILHKKIQTMNFRLKKFKFSSKLLSSIKILYPNTL